MNITRPLTISNVSAYSTSNVAIGPPIVSATNILSPRRGSNGFTFTPSSTFVGGSAGFIEPQYPPAPILAPVVNRGIVGQPAQALLQPITPPLNPAFAPIVTPPLIPPLVRPLTPIMQTSTIYATPVVATTYTNLPLPMRNSIAGFSFPELAMMNENYALAGSDYERLPLDASFAKMSTKIICPRCGQVVMTNVQLELGFASYCWCVTLLPLACTGLCCLCLPDCKDRIHYCNCGEVVGYNRNSAC